MATGDMAGGGGGEGESEGGPGYVLSLPAAWLPLPVAVSCLDATVRRKARSRLRLRAQPSGWWAFKLPVVPAPEEAKRPVPPASAVNNPTEAARPQRLRVRQAPVPDPAAVERPAKRARLCLQCGAAVTPQWRAGPLGRSTLCNACGVRYRQGRLLPEYRPIASPTFEPSEHANRHSQVLQLHRHRKSQSQSHHQQHPLPVEHHPPRAMDVLQFPPQRWHVKEEYPPTPVHQPLSLAGGVGGMMVDAAADADAGQGGDRGKGSDLNNAPSSLDSLLLEGPSAPLLVDGDQPLID